MAHTLELAAEIKKIESQGEAANSDKSDFAPPTTGRGHKGIVQKVAERQNVDQAAVRKRAQKVADTIGEPVDLQKDTPEELTRKAAKFREAPKARRVRKIDDVRRAFPDGRIGYVASERGFDAMREDMAKGGGRTCRGRRRRAPLRAAAEDQRHPTRIGSARCSTAPYE